MAGRPSKIPNLLKEEKWKQIELLARGGLPILFAAKVMGCGKDTLLRVIEEKGYKSWKELKETGEQLIRTTIKNKILTQVEEDNASDRILMFAYEKMVEPFEEHNQVKDENENVKIVYVPVADFGNEDKLQEAVVNQQEDLMARIEEHKRQMDLE